MTILTHGLAAIGGFALCWFSKDLILHAFVGTEVFVRNLEAKASALRAAVHAKAL